MERVIFNPCAMTVIPKQRAMGKAGGWEGESDARKRARPVRWGGNTRSSYDEMLIPLSFKWRRSCSYCGINNTLPQVEHIQAKASSGTDRVSNLCLVCDFCNKARDTRDIQIRLVDKPDLLARLLAQVKALLKDTAAVHATRWALDERLKARGLPVECGSGGRTTFNRMTGNLPEEHRIDVACVSKSTPQGLQGTGIIPVLITANGHDSRHKCNVNEIGFPCSKPKVAKKIKGFQTGDLVLAVITARNKQGVLCRASAGTGCSFDICTNVGWVQEISHRSCTLVHRCDGYSYTRGEQFAQENSAHATWHEMCGVSWHGLS